MFSISTVQLVQPYREIFEVKVTKYEEMHIFKILYFQDCLWYRILSVHAVFPRPGVRGIQNFTSKVQVELCLCIIENVGLLHLLRSFFTIYISPLTTKPIVSLNSP